MEEMQRSGQRNGIVHDLLLIFVMAGAVVMTAVGYMLPPPGR